MTQPDLFDPATKYPDRPGFREQTTSREAADKTAKRAPGMRDQVLGVLQAKWPFGLRADEVAAVMGRSILAIRPRFSELRAMGLIKPTEERRKNDSGMNATVWIATRRA